MTKKNMTIVYSMGHCTYNAWGMANMVCIRLFTMADTRNRRYGAGAGRDHPASYSCAIDSTCINRRLIRTNFVVYLVAVLSYQK